MLIRKTEPGNRIIDLTYNSLGLIATKKVYPNGVTAFTTTYQYDTKGNLIKEITHDGKESIFTYDLAGNLVSSTNKQSELLQATTLYQYDQFGRLIKVTSPKSEATEYQYNSTGQLVVIKDPHSKEVAFEYDTKGRLLKKTDQFGLSFEFSYDLNGNLVSEKDPKGQIRTYEYDELNQLAQVTFPDDRVTYTYNLRQEVVKVENSTSQIVYTRNSRNWVISALTTGKGSMADYPMVQMNYSYDENGNRTSLDSSVGRIDYIYNLNNQLTGLTNSWGHNFGFSYDEAGRLTQIERPGSTSVFGYTAGGAMGSIQHLQGSTLKSLAQYSYDLRNYPIQKRTLAGDFNYSYDLNGQLTSVSGLQNESFGYDSLGNRIIDGEGNYIYDANSQRLAEDWQYYYQYDLNGNLISKIPKNQSAKAYQYDYSSKNQLVRVRILASALGIAEREIIFTYDVFGRRLEKEVIDVVNSASSYSRKFIYDGESIIAEYDGKNLLLARYTYSPLLPDDILSADLTSDAVVAGLSSASGSVFYLKDALGSVTDIVNGSGNVIQSYQYSSFGKIANIKDSSGVDVTSNSPMKTSFTFTGRESDYETGLYYYRARYYDPNIGRFLQKDPDPGKVMNPITVVNSYTYVGNNPISLTDPTGKTWLSDFLHSPGRAIGNLLSSKEFQIAAIVVAAVVTGGAAGLAAGSWASSLVGGFVGGSLGAALGVTAGVIAGGVAGAIVGAQVGAFVGAVSGGIGASLQGRDIQTGINSGAKLGMEAGAIAGGLAGAGTYLWGGNPYGAIGKLVQKNTAEFLISGSLLPALASQIGRHYDPQQER